MSPCIVPLPIKILFVVRPVERWRTILVEVFAYMPRMTSIASGGNPNSCKIKYSFVWLMV